MGEVKQTNGDKHNSKRLSEERYSTNYETEAEFLMDQSYIAKMLYNKDYVDKDIVDKAAATVEELAL